jgi:hypothetical protein
MRQPEILAACMREHHGEGFETTHDWLSIVQQNEVEQALLDLSVRLAELSVFGSSLVR